MAGNTSGSKGSFSSSSGGASPLSPQLIIGAVVAVLAVVFVAQNRRETKVQFLFIDARMRVWTIIVISMLIGALLARLLPKAAQRARKK